MNGLMKKYYDEIKELLLQGNSSNLGDEELEMKAHFLERNYDRDLDNLMATTKQIEIDGEAAICGLFTKFRRLFGEPAQINRTPGSPLSSYPGGEYETIELQCPYSEEEIPDIQKQIIGYINDQARTIHEGDTYCEPLLSGLQQKEISTDKLLVIASNLKTISHAMVEYINQNVNSSWNWRYDCEFLAQYIFEKAIELTYYITKGSPIENLSYDVDEAFSYFQTNIPNKLQEKVDSVVGELQELVTNTTWFIKENKYNRCDKEAWLSPFLFEIGTIGIWFTLEQDI